MSQPLTPVFADIVQLIATAKQRAIQAVNTLLINLYLQIGEIINNKTGSVAHEN
jgi:hypothetical protein